MKKIKLIYIILSIATLLLLTSCTGVNNYSQSGEGRIVLALSRGAELSSLGSTASFAGITSTGISEEAGLMVQELPRTVETALGLLEGYLIRIQNGAGEDIAFDEYYFGEENLINAAYTVEAGEQYTVTLLALGPLSSPGDPSSSRLLLGAGRNQVVVTSSGEDTPVYVPMLTYRYSNQEPSFENTEQGGMATVPFMVMGPLLEEIFEIGGTSGDVPPEYSELYDVYYPSETSGKLYYTTSTPESDFNNPNNRVPVEQVSALISRDTAGCGYDIIMYTAEIQSSSSRIYLQLELSLNSDWSGEGFNMQFLVPAFYSGEQFYSFDIPVPR